MKKQDNPDRLYYGKPCKYGHQQSDGLNPRSDNGVCRACTKHLPPGIIETLTGCHLSMNDIPDYRTPEKKEKDRQTQVKASTEWNARNPDKVAVYKSTYYSKPKTKARQCIANKKRYEKRKEDPVAYRAWLDQQRIHQRASAARKAQRDLETDK